jgi:phage regulator Rha-like protein
MAKKFLEVSIPDEFVMSKIFVIRNQRVMIGKDLAELYGVVTKQLNQQVKRNSDRFPENFMFQLTEEEKDEVVTNCDHLRSLRFSSNLPYAFTEHGVLMLANVLKSERAIQMSIRIIEVFIKMREMLLTHKDILLQLEKIETKLTGHDEEIQLIFKYLKQLLNPPQQPRKKIGFKRSNED